MSLCEDCGKQDASFEAVMNVNGETVTRNICERCYNKLYLSSHDSIKNIYNKLSGEVQETIFKARKVARDKRHKEVDNLHLIHGICTGQSFATDILRSLDASPNVISKKTEMMMASIVDLHPRGSLTEPNISTEAIETLEESVNIISKLEFSEITSEIILIAVLESKSLISRVLKKDFNLSVVEILKEMSSQLDGSVDLVAKYKGASDNKKALEKFSRNLNELALKGKLDPCIGREEEVDRLVHILSRRTKNNCVLVGEPGVGKTCIAEGLAQRIIEYKVPKNLIDKKVLALDLTALVAGTRFRGEFEERIKAVLEDIKKDSRKTILFIDELHTIIGAGGNAGSNDAANILKPALARGELQCIGATTYDEYSLHIESDRALERRFQKLDVSEPSKNDAIAILCGIKNRYSDFHKVSVDDETVRSAVDMSIKYVPGRCLPDKAIDLMDEALAKVKLKQLILPESIVSLRHQILEKKKNKEDVVEIEKQLREELDKIKQGENLSACKEDIAQIVARWIGVPATELLTDEKQKLLNLENILHKKVVGQEFAIKSLCDAIRRSRVGVTDGRRPITSAIFAGKTGVGKTLIAQTIASYLFGGKKNFLKLDMSEYMEKHTVSKLIGAPPGYVGYDAGGQLVEHVRRYPYSVILFDEIEKAHPDIFNTFLQIMEDGELTDNKGKKADFKNTIIIMTTNIAASESSYDIGFTKDTSEDDYDKLKERTEKALKRDFKPEFLNRVDDILVFHQLSEDDIVNIVGIELNEFKVRVVDFNIEFEDMTEFIAKESFSKEYGARSIRRWIQKNIENKLAIHILEKDLAKKSKITIGVKDKKVEIK